ncbi:hypothetical protein IQ266_07725 [filamentous cyanobacterium LEGE 11480]|uniref:FIST domain-containing protein n=1 Tax=Romeriopsis navalis LEGE 11480 TaxID=2777977 RepID=A0A928VJ93_9CYAN|nr:FIST N-terminal domain-containing protein [Romeriopsis navalis]MBE9029616.1 hypothetical protein [Romeriopsis navalis LEGE 11480]
MFATVGYRQDVLLQTVRQSTAHAPLIGCSSTGVIAQGIADESNFSIVVIVVRSDELTRHYGIEPGVNISSASFGENAQRQL